MRVIYTVTGNSTFPLDMLRSDQSFPMRSEDVWEIAADGDAAWRKREVQLGADMPAHQEPNKERWRSFGWTVTEIHR